MSLFPRWSGSLTLPALPERKHKVGTNWIIQKVLPETTTAARLADSQFEGHDLITTSLSAPFDEILLRRKAAKRINTKMPVVISHEIEDYEKPPSKFALRWDTRTELDDFANTPDKVLGAWANCFSFKVEDEENSLPGLRAPQIGALHAISAHFAVGQQFEPATVVLPTGTGKTETMLATLVYRRLPRLLVLVPSDVLRAQIAQKFITLGILPIEAQVLPPEIARPRVAVLSTGIRTVEDASEILAQSNVIVTLPNTLAASEPAAVQALLDGCTDLVVDEAHHITADSWMAVRDRFLQKRILQFTATPFRRDEQRVDGRIIFNFKLGDAQRAGYYKKIQLITVEEYGDQGERDKAIAAAAVRALRHDREKLGHDHLLMARAKTKERAQEVFDIYMKLAPDLKPELIYSGTGRGELNRQAQERLFDRGNNGSRIVVCVGMLGEGFDLPNLKVAALHDTHRSIAVTLQFIGRFTRRGSKEALAKIGDATVIANIADPQTEKKLTALYAEGADWDQLVSRLSEESVEREVKLQNVIDALKTSGTLHEQLSLWNLRPPLSAQFFRTSCEKWTPTKYVEALPQKAETWHSLDESGNVLVAVVQRPAEVSWGTYENVFDTIYDLIAIRWNPEENSLALFASDYDALRSETMAKLVSDGTADLVAGDPIFNVLNNVELPLVKQLGSSRVGAISFTNYFGPNVTEGLTGIEQSEATLNNIACLGYEHGERVLWGATQKRGKVWHQKRGSISEWLDWTAMTWGKVTSGKAATNITQSFLRPTKLDAHYPSVPIAAQWGEQVQYRNNDSQSVLFDEIDVPVYAVDLIVDSDAPNGIIRIRFESETASAEYDVQIEKSLPGGYRHIHRKGSILKFKVGRREPILLEEYLQRDPLLVRYADGTFSYNCYHIPVPLEPGLFDTNKLEVWDWAGIPLNKESMHKAGELKTIQGRTFAQLKDEYDIIFNDDGCGEAADLVCIRDGDDSTIHLCLVHCKGAYGGKVSQDIRNFYVVCGQAQKSIVSKHAGMGRLYLDLKRRYDAWMTDGANRFLKGDIKRLSYFRDKGRRAKIDFEMILVQPGASASTITEDARRLLATTELFVKKTTEAKFRVIVSP